LIRVHEINNLGVLFDTTLTYNNHLLHTVKKSSRILGFIIRNSKDFTNPVVFKTLYTYLIRSKIKYSSVVWSAYLNYQIQCLDNVQNQFLWFMAFKSDLTRVQHFSY